MLCYIKTYKNFCSNPKDLIQLKFWGLKLLIKINFLINKFKKLKIH